MENRDMFFDFKREGAKLTIWVHNPRLELGHSHLGFSLDFGNDSVAEIVLRYIKKEYDEMRENEREELYNMGYVDGRSKKKRMYSRSE